MKPEQALRIARAVAGVDRPPSDEDSLAGALAAQLPAWPDPRRRKAAREALLLRQLLGGPDAAAGSGPEGGHDTAVAALGLCLARPAAEPVWVDFERLLELLESLEVELRAQRRRARLPGSPGRRATAEAAGTREVMSRAAAEFSAVWRVSGSVVGEHPLDP